MFSIIITLIIIISVLLIIVVLAQNPKGGGVSSQFGGSATSQIIGVKKTGDLLEKITWGLAISLLVLSLSTILFLNKGNDEGTIASPNVEKAKEKGSMQNFNTKPAAPITVDSTKNSK